MTQLETVASTSSPSDVLSTVLKEYAGSQSQAVESCDIATLAFSIVQLCQLSFSDPARNSAAFLRATGTLIAHFPQFNWSGVNFPIIARLQSQEYADKLAANGIESGDTIRLSVVLAFLNVLAASPEYATADTLDYIFNEELAAVIAANPPNRRVSNYRVDLLKVFTPGAVNALELEPLQIVVYRPELASGIFGPELWGLAYTDRRDRTHVMLETGEYIEVPATALTLAMAKGYATSEVPLQLLACANLFFPLFWSIHGSDISDERLVRIKSNLGQFNGKMAISFRAPSDLQKVSDALNSPIRVIDGSSSPAAVVTILELPDTDFNIGIGVDFSAKRPFIHSALLDRKSRRELATDGRPRECSVYGVYLFGALDTAAAVVCFPV